MRGNRYRPRQTVSSTKKFRKSEEFGKDLPQEKMDSFAKVLQKFFESEAEDAKKDADTRTPDYTALTDKANRVDFDFSLKFSISAIDRDAMRRYHYAQLKGMEAEEKGMWYPANSPTLEKVWIINNDTASHEFIASAFEQMKKDLPNLKGWQKENAEKMLKEGLPPIGQNIPVMVPQVLHEHFAYLWQSFKAYEKHLEATKGTDALLKWLQEDGPNEWSDSVEKIINQYFAARHEIESYVETEKAWFRSRRDMPGKTKADIVKEMWKYIPEATGKKAPPLDPEFLAMLSKFPASPPHEMNHPWGTASKLYKAEAIDPFGDTYLLGIYETKEEARQAFDKWNAEYEKAGKDMRVEMDQWAKQEQAKMDSDATGQSVLLKALEEARR